MSYQLLPFGWITAGSSWNAGKDQGSFICRPGMPVLPLNQYDFSEEHLEDGNASKRIVELLKIV